MKRSLTPILLAMFLLPAALPFASAAGMVACTLNGGECDTWDKNDDGTANQQDWIEGVYTFDLVDTATINLEMNWALHEFNRTTLGLTQAPVVAALAAEGLTPQDGAPADLIRNYFDENSGGPGTPTVKEKLALEVNDTIEELLGSGFGQVDYISTTYVNSFTDAGITTSCTDDPTLDTAVEAGLDDNVFQPPICFSVSASVSLSTSTFNMGTVDPLVLERVYQGMLVMGSDVTSGFQLFSEPGHSSSFIINPPDYATILSTDPSGTIAARTGPPAFMAAEWNIDNRDAPLAGERISSDVSVTIGHRNSTQTSSVVIDDNDKGLDLRVTLDLSNEEETWVEVVASVHHLDQQTMQNWGISLVDVTENATIPWVTSDGIRLAYHNGLVDLDSFTSNFPMELIGDAIEGAVPSVGSVVMNDMEWVSDSQTIGLPGPGGGLNFSHPDCPESLPVGMDAFYCVEGGTAMDGGHPIILRSYSEPFTLKLLDIAKSEIDDPSGLLDAIVEDDLRMILESGLTIETILDSTMMSAMIPTDMPPTELTLEIILPNWVTSATGDGSIVLIDRIQGADQLDVSLGSVAAYNPRHSIVENAGTSNEKEICTSIEADWTCINLDVDADIYEINFHEWGPSIDATASLTATIDIYRIKVPNSLRENMSSGDTSVDIEVIPSDLLRLIIDISSRMDSPISKEVDPGDGSGMQNVSFTKNGIESFVEDFGKMATDAFHEKGLEISEEDPASTIDFSGIQIVTEVENLGGMGATIGDDIPIRLKLTIPKFTADLGVLNGWGGLKSGNPEIGLTTAFQPVITQYLVAFSDLLVGSTSQFLTMSGDGIILDEDGAPIRMPVGPQDMILSDEFDAKLRGDVTFTMPSGILLKDFTSENGWEEVKMVDGRQQITVTLESWEVGDEFQFRLQVTWWWLFGQIWIYPALLAALIIWRVRARKAKKKRKQEAKLNMQKPSVSKGGLSDDDFASLASGFEPAHAETDMDFMDDDFDMPEIAADDIDIAETKTDTDLYQEIYGDD